MFKFIRDMKDKIESLERKVESLEKSRVGKIEYGEWPKFHSICELRGRESIKVDEAVKMIFKHLGIEIVETPKKPAVIEIKKIDKRKNRRK